MTIQNAFIENEGIAISPVMSRADAEQRVKALMPIYPHAEVINTDAPIKDKAKRHNGKPEEIEDKGCASGACSL